MLTGSRIRNVTLRSAENEDALFVWETRNEETVRATSHEQALIPWGYHLRWWGYNSAYTLIIESYSKRVGYIRTGVGTKSAGTISIALIPSVRGKGIGTQALRAMQRHAVRTGIRVLDAYIDRANAASRKAFTKAGFVEEPNALLISVVHVMWEGACRHCAAGAPHHQLAESSIGGTRTRTCWDIHEVEDTGGVGLQECTAASLWDEALA